MLRSCNFGLVELLATITNLHARVLFILSLVFVFYFFLQAGPLEKVSIARDRDGRIRGYAFVTFKHECSVPYAMNLMKGIQLFGRQLNLQNRTGSKADNIPTDYRSQHHQQNMSPSGGYWPNQGGPYTDLQSFNNLIGMAGLLSGNPMLQYLMQQLHQGVTQPPQYQNHEQSRSYHGGDRYHEGNNREDRREYNSGDRYRSRDNDYHGRTGDNNYLDRYSGASRRDRERYRDRDQDRRSNHHPYDNRYGRH